VIRDFYRTRCDRVLSRLFGTSQLKSERYHYIGSRSVQYFTYTATVSER
jgi:hypothetical protein